MATSVAAEVEDLRERLENLQASMSRSLTKMCRGLKESSGDSKGKAVQDYSVAYRELRELHRQVP
jgi:hypothetical protein